MENINFWKYKTCKTCGDSFVPKDDKQVECWRNCLPYEIDESKKE